MTSNAVAGLATGHARLRTSVVVGACVVLPGFVALALLGSLRTYPAGLPGFWLVPTIILALVAQAQALRQWQKPGESGVQITGAVLGALSGIAVPLSWYLDPHTSHLWMLPRAHHYLLAGWWHLGYLTAAAAGLGGLMVTVLGRLRRAPTATSGLPDGYSPTAMVFVVGAGLGMLMLIGRDAVAGGKTAASGSTIISLVVVAAVFLGGLGWAVGTVKWHRLATPAAIVATFLLGLLGVIVRWEPNDALIVGIGTVTASLACAAATSTLDSHAGHHSYRWPTAIAMTTIVVAGLIRSSDALLRGQSKPLLWMVGALVIAFGLLTLVGRGHNDVRRTVRYGLFVGYCMLMYYLAARVRSPMGEHSAGASVSVADAAFDVMVFTLIQTRFGDWAEADKPRVKAEFIFSPEEASVSTELGEGSRSTDVLTDMLFLGIAVGLSLFLLLVVSAIPLGLDRAAVEGSRVRVVLLIGVIAAALFGLLSDGLLGRWRERKGEPPRDSRLRHHGLYLPRWFAAAAVGAAAAWSAAVLILSGGPVHLPLLAALAAVVVFTFSAHSLLSTPVRLQMLRPTPGQAVLAIVAAAAIALGCFWFVGIGAWQGEHPLTGGWLAGTTICVFAGTAIVYVAAGRALAAGLPAKRRETQYVLARQEIQNYVGLDGIDLGIVFVIGVGLPLYAATRDEEVHASSLNVIASMVFLPGLISAIFWGLGSWKNWEKLNVGATQRGGISRPIFALADNDWEEAKSLDAIRSKRFLIHLRLNRYAMIALMACGLVYLAEVLLS
jgi:hypothetical protein